MSSSDTAKEDIRRDETESESTSMITDDETLPDLTAPSTSTATADDDRKMYLGIYSKAAGLTEQDMLERSISVVDDASLLKLGMLFEIYSYCQKHQLRVAVCVDIFKALLPDEFEKGETVDRSLRTKAKRLYEDVRKIRRDQKGTKRSEQLENLLDKPYKQRQSSVPTATKTQLKPKIDDQQEIVTNLTRQPGKESHQKGNNNKIQQIFKMNRNTNLVIWIYCKTSSKVQYEKTDKMYIHSKAVGGLGPNQAEYLRIWSQRYRTMIVSWKLVLILYIITLDL